MGGCSVIITLTEATRRLAVFLVEHHTGRGPAEKGVLQVDDAQYLRVFDTRKPTVIDRIDGVFGRKFVQRYAPADVGHYLHEVRMWEACFSSERGRQPRKDERPQAQAAETWSAYL